MNAISDFVDTRREEGDDNNRLIDYINSVQLLTDQDTDGDGDDNHITLMTVHSAKGLEFPSVFIVGLEEGLFPNQMAQNSMRELEEERRLFYVAVTRAMDYCMLTFAKSRYRFGQFEFCEPSRFLKDVNSNYLTFNGVAPQSKPSRPEPQRGMFAATNERRGYVRSDYSLDNHKPLQRERIQERRVEQQPVQRIMPVNRLQRVSDVVRDATTPNVAANARLAVGDIVRHERFGVGQVLALEGAGENAKAKINFRNAGEKTLLLKFAKLAGVE